MSAYRVIDKLESVVREGAWMPFGWRAVNAERVLDLIEKLRTTLPDDASRARRGDGAGRAQEPPREAGPPAAEEPKARSEESDALARAQARADDIVAQAQHAARDIRRGADEYAEQVLASLDASLGKALAAVQKGRQALAGSAPSNGKTTREMSAT